MSGILPEKIRLRNSKIGFDTPEDEWFRDDIFGNYINEILRNSRKLPEYINTKKALKQFELHQKGERNISKEIWKWINLELWFQKYF